MYATRIFLLSCLRSLDRQTLLFISSATAKTMSRTTRLSPTAAVTMNSNVTSSVMPTSSTVASTTKKLVGNHDDSFPWSNSWLLILLVVPVIILVAYLVKRRRLSFARSSNAKSFNDKDTQMSIELDELSHKPLKPRASEEKTSWHNFPFVEHARKVVGPAGGTIAVGGCTVVVPDNALDSEIQIDLTSSYEADSSVNRLTALLKCEPHGMKFLRDVEITLPTCFITDGETSVTATVRRSKDGIHWEDVKQVGHKSERTFQFTVKSFSWYDVIVSMATQYVLLQRQKSVVCGIPHPYSVDPPVLKLVCYVFDAVLDKSHLKCQEVYSTTVSLESNEADVLFQMTCDDMHITPDDYRIENARMALEEQAQFVLTKKDTSLLYRMITICIQTSGKTTTRTFFIHSSSESQRRDSAASNSKKRVTEQNIKVVGRNVKDSYVGFEKLTVNHHHHYPPRSPSAEKKLMGGEIQSVSRRSSQHDTLENSYLLNDDLPE